MALAVRVLMVKKERKKEMYFCAVRQMKITHSLMTNKFPIIISKKKKINFFMDKSGSFTSIGLQTLMCHASEYRP